MSITNPLPGYDEWKLQGPEDGWADTYCDECGHHDRYHFEDGEGKVFCRWDNLCACAECPPAIRAHSIAGEQS